MGTVMVVAMVTIIDMTVAIITQDTVGVVTQAVGLEGDGVGDHLLTPLRTEQALARVILDQEPPQVCINV